MTSNPASAANTRPNLPFAHHVQVWISLSLESARNTLSPLYVKFGIKSNSPVANTPAFPVTLTLKNDS